MDELVKFIGLSHDFKKVRRKIALPNEDREENDAEHSYQLALVAWYLISTQNLDLDVNLAIRYALVHDLVEIYAGDTPSSVHKGFDKERETKYEREERAAKQLLEEFPEFSTMHELIGAYELRNDNESKFVYALDKILPVVNIYLDRGYAWKKDNITLEDIINDKSDKVAFSPEIKKYFEQIVELLRLNQATLFPESGESKTSVR